MKKSEIKKLIAIAAGFFPNFKLSEAVEGAWYSELDRVDMGLEEGRALLSTIRTRKEFVSVIDLVEEFKRSRALARARSAPEFRAVRVEVKPLEILPDAVLEKLSKLPSSEFVSDPVNGRTYFRTTSAGVRVREHFLRKQNPRAVKVLTHFSDGKIASRYCYDGKPAEVIR